MTMMIDRFDELAGIYGAHIDLWPAGEQAAAHALAKTSPEAQAVLEREYPLDSALDTWKAPAPSDALMARILGDAAAVGAANITPVTASLETKEKQSFFLQLFGGYVWRPAGAMMACLAIGFVAGISGDTAPTGTNSISAGEDNAVIANFFGDEDEGDPFDLEIL